MDTHESEFSYKSSGTFPTDGEPLSGDAGSMTYARTQRQRTRMDASVNYKRHFLLT
jgi:hypothetical protein